MAGKACGLCFAKITEKTRSYLYVGDHIVESPLCRSCDLEITLKQTELKKLEI